jgi:hypothetical protein
LSACGQQKPAAVQASAVPRNAEPSFTSIESPSLAFLPRQQEAAGWRLDEDPIVIPGDHLDAYFEKESTHFARYEALDVTIGKYTSTSGNNSFATVEIFRFPDFVKSFGAYSTRKNGAMKFLDIPNESFQKAHSVHVWRGPFYVRVTSDAADGAMPLVRFVADRMPVAPSKPAVFNFLPDKLRVVGSERYSAEAGFGQAYLANSFQATFNVDGDLVDGLIIPAANKQAAANILNAYRALYVRNGKLLDPIPNLGEDNFTAEDKYLGRAVAFRIDRFVIAFNGYRERQHLVDLAAVTDQRILGTIRKQLVLSDKEADNAPAKTDTTPAWQRR